MVAILRSSIQSRHRHGSVLIEFAIVALMLYLIIAAIFTFGHALFITEALQHTTDIFAHELARTPLPPEDTLEQALQDPSVTQNLFNQADLEINLTPWLTGNTGLTLDQWLQIQGWPMINRLLAPLMILDPRSDGTYLWYPGAVPDANGNYYIAILSGNGTNGPTTYPVIEAVSDPDTFPLGSVPTTGTTATPTGLAGIRLNFAYQSAFLSSYTYEANSQPVSSPVGQQGHITDVLVTTTEQPDIVAYRGGLYGGPDHLGQQIVGGSIARPFQRLISAQSVYRREVYGPDTTPATGP